MIDPVHRHFIATQQLVPALINTVLNGWIAWAMHHDAAGLALWGGSGRRINQVMPGNRTPVATRSIA